ncbi:hypothetical protein, partial [Bradyrhizobium guangdongense]|uniref:hypothetical protein n=1 Tax=Bradyrhizobium guangdongense TaxID=1325090 RepID=UPI001AEC75ED
VEPLRSPAAFGFINSSSLLRPASRVEAAPSASIDHLGRHSPEARNAFDAAHPEPARRAGLIAPSSA